VKHSGLSSFAWRALPGYNTAITRRFQFSLKARPAKRDYVGGFVWAFFGDDGDDGMSWEPLVGFIAGWTAGWLVDRFIAPFVFALIGAFIGLVAGAIIVAIRVSDEPRPHRQNGDDESDPQQ
jgi:hypothetical protein